MTTYKIEFMYKSSAFTKTFETENKKDFILKVKEINELYNKKQIKFVHTYVTQIYSTEDFLSKFKEGLNNDK